MKIIYPVNDGIAVLIPTGELTAELIARKDVPYGVPYLVVEDTALPEDRLFRDAWEADFSNPDGYGLGTQRWLIQQAQSAIDRGENVEANTALIAQMKAEVLQIEGVQL